LSASPGSWSGTTPLSYAYQWQRCDSNGGSCAPVAGATAIGYLLASVDVGSTMRVSVTASNSAGSATASSVATAAVLGDASTPLLPGTLLYEKSADIGTVSPLPWPNIEDPDPDPAWKPAIFSDPAGSGKKVLALTTTPKDGGVPATSQRNDVADWSFQSKTNIAGQGSDIWMRAEVMFPRTLIGSRTAFRPVSGEWNWFYQWHYNSSISVSGFHTELALGVQTDSNAQNPYIFGIIKGGDVKGCSSDTCSGITSYRWNTPANSLQFDHWYNMLFHIKWSHNSDGFVKIWIDGTQVVDRTQPTLYWRSDTGYSDTLYPVLSNYHAAVSQNASVDWNSTIYFRDWEVGTTQSSVGG
jgi:hypothetical protein